MQAIGKYQAEKISSNRYSRKTAVIPAPVSLIFTVMCRHDHSLRMQETIIIYCPPSPYSWSLSIKYLAFISHCHHRNRPNGMRSSCKMNLHKVNENTSDAYEVLILKATNREMKESYDEPKTAGSWSFICS